MTIKIFVNVLNMTSLSNYECEHDDYAMLTTGTEDAYIN